MTTDSGLRLTDVTQEVVSVALELSRAHLLLSGTAEGMPPAIRPETDEVLASLERATARLRSAAVAIEIAAAD